MEEQQPKSRNFSFEGLWGYIRSRFDLDADKAAEDEVKDNIKKGVEFRGTYLWLFIFATFIASLGLNMNSAAVIIGAMLISPLMGPIMGIGLSVGINDFELMKRSLRNFGLMVLIGILTSTFYFWLSPLSEAKSELLARTMPTIYDVLIAFFGGLAGIVAQSRKDRTSTVIPGVAIATALMPPLCTAGYGLATWQLNYFIGAFYLFFINTVFIAIATFIVVRFLKYRKKVFLDSARERQVRRYILIIVIVTMIPSVVLALKIIRQSIFETAADRYVSAVMHFPKAQVIDYKRNILSDGRRQIEVVLIGEPVSSDAIENARLQLPAYNLEGTDLVVRQSGQGEPVNINTLQKSYAELLEEKNNHIRELESRLSVLSEDTLPSRDITREMIALAPDIAQVNLTRSFSFDTQGRAVDTMVICLIRLKDQVRISSAEQQRIVGWLKTRTKSDKVQLYVE